MSGSEHDPELEAFLKRRSPIHRRLADFDHAEPSIELDRLVLNRAREAIDSPAQPPMFRTARWAMPLGLAATILIAFTIILNIDQRKPRLEKTAAAAKTEQPAAPAARLTANRAEGAAADARTPAQSNAAPPSVAARAKPAATANAEPAAARERQDARSEKKTAAPPLVASTRSGYFPPLAPSPEQRSADEPQVAASTAADAATAEAESDLSASQVEQRRAGSVSGQPLVASGSAMSAATDRAAASPAPASPPPAAAAAAAAPPAYQASAESWLREINRLRSTGKTAEAERELTAFRQAYPSHPGYSLARPPTR